MSPIRYRRAEAADVPALALLPGQGEAGAAAGERMLPYLQNERARRFYTRHGAAELWKHWLVWEDIGIVVGSPVPTKPGQAPGAAAGVANLRTGDRGMTYVVEFSSTLFKIGDKGGWTFAPVPEHLAPPVTEGWGRTPVVATVDGREWKTSVWRERSGRTLLPVPRAVRAGKEHGDAVQVSLRFGLI